jgi:SAM-dependent methyltransferase
MASWAKEVAEILYNEIPKELNEAETHILDIINGSDGIVIDFPCWSGKVLSFMKDKSKYTGIDFRHSFIDIAKKIINEDDKTRPENIKFKFHETFDSMVKGKLSAQTIVSLGYVNYERDPVSFINSMIDSVKAEQIFIAFEYAKENGLNLGETRFKGVGRENGFVFNLFSQEAIEKIAEQTNLNVNLFTGEVNNIALLFRIPEKKLTVKEEVITDIIEDNGTNVDEINPVEEELIKQDKKSSDKAKNKKSK